MASLTPCTLYARYGKAPCRLPANLHGLTASRVLSLASEYCQTRALQSNSAPGATHRGRTRADVTGPSRLHSTLRPSSVRQQATARHAVGARRNHGGCLFPASLLTKNVVGAGGATTKCSPRPRHPGQVLRQVAAAVGVPVSGKPMAAATYGRRPG